MDENRAVPIPHSSSILEFYCSTNSPSAAPHVHQTAIITNLHLTISISTMLGSSAVIRLQCHMWARLHLNVHPSSSFRIEGQSFHSSANISCSVKPTCHLNSFILRLLPTAAPPLLIKRGDMALEWPRPQPKRDLGILPAATSGTMRGFHHNDAA